MGSKTCILVGIGCVILAVVVLVVVGVGLVFFGLFGDRDGGFDLFGDRGGIISLFRDGSTGELGGTTTEETLENFFESDTKYGTADVDKWGGGRETEDKEIEFWVKGRRFRIDYYRNDGSKRIGIISPDGIMPYFCRSSEGSCKPAVASVDHYLDMFVKPAAAMADAGYDSEFGCDKYRYVVKKTDNIPGAINPWYTEDYVYCVKIGELVYVESRGDNPKPGESLDLTTYRKEFTKLEVNKTIPDSTFELPYSKTTN